MGATSPRVSIVLPVRDAESHVAACIEACLAQLRSEDEFIVVDDGSTDGTPNAVRKFHHVRLVQPSDAPSGPYAARNVGWRASTAPVVCFVDVRARPRPDWLNTLREAFADRRVAMACSDIIVDPGKTVAQRVMHRRQHLRIQDYVDDPWFLPYFVTCNLAVRRSALEAVEGFRPIRSGGDADLCWRIQLSGLGELAVAPGVGMDWCARSRVRDLLGQCRKYGASNAYLRWWYREAGAPTAPPKTRRRIALDVALAALRAPWTGRDSPVFLLDALATAATDSAYRRTYAELVGRPSPPLRLATDVLAPPPSGTRPQ